MLTIRVMKFGGTSVADAVAIRRVAAIVAAERRRGSNAVVIVSAMAGVTDRLLAMADEAVRGGRDSFQHGFDELRRRHLDAADQLVARGRRSAAAARLEPIFEQLHHVLTGIAALGEASARSRDSVASAGELLSSLLVAEALREDGLDGVWIDARRVILTDDNHAGAAPLEAPTIEAVTREVTPHLHAGRVPVAGGFIGATPAGVTTTLGRGGSDYSAAIIGAALHAGPAPDAALVTHDRPNVEIQIWTDVDGMLAADPRIIPAPAVVPHLSFGEASELAYFGAKVLHPSTILPAVRRGIAVRILNSRRAEGPGTLISAGPPVSARPVAALACKRQITVVEVTSSRMLMAHGFLRRLFEVFERYQTPVDVVTTSEVSVSVTIDDDRHLDRIAADLGEFADVAVERDMALLCAVGDNLRRDATMAIRLLGSLEGLPLRMVSQASTRRNVTVVLHERDLAAAMTRLHDAWLRSPASDGTRGAVPA